MGVGFAKDAESNNKFNRKQAKDLKGKYFKPSYKLKRKNSLHTKKASPQTLQEIRQKLMKQKRSEKQITLLVIVLLLTITLVIILL